MYAALFRLLPGPIWLKIIWTLLILAAVVYALFTWVYPWASDTFMDFDPNMGG
ncbi:hypothetical protein [Timonella senegalensis]|uniref:hypothetical protein n=1 Tax=Timonella senegalensis TaxID=1465825 RepID=UPI0002FB93CF|nr:hypothetical protein [Timonella senegalensis]